MKLNLQIDLDTSLGGALALAVILGAGLLYLYIGGGTERMIDATLKQSQNASAIARVEAPKVTSVADDFSASNVPAVVTVPPKSIIPAASQTPPVNPPDQANQNKSIVKINIADKTIGNVVHSYANSEEEQFKHFYIKPAKCLDRAPYDQETLVACGNDYIRTRSKFAELWVKLHSSPEEIREKEQFEAFDIKSAKCRDHALLDQKTLVACANDYIRTRSKLEESLAKLHPSPEETRKKAKAIVKIALRDGEYLAQ